MAYFADRSRPRDTGGSGLGLAICYQLVDALGGSVTVESAVGVGATFTIRLPAWD
jgi:signal transduction histidine kinase